MKKTIKYIVEFPFLLIAILIVLYEEFLWDKITYLINLFKKINIFNRLGLFITNSHPMVSVLSFFLPIIVLFPLKLFAIFLLSKGHIIFGASCYFLIKITGVALAKWIFIYAEKPLRSVKIVNSLINITLELTQKIKKLAHNNAIYNYVSTKITVLKSFLTNQIHTLKDFYSMKFKSKKRKFFHVIKYKKLLDKNN